MDQHSAHTLQSMKWLFAWIAAALAADAGIWYLYGADRAVDFLGGYLIELSLSIDNVFVFLMIFMSFGIAERAQHRVLGWGICGAIVLRFLFIFFGVAVVTRFAWVLYFFGAMLIVSGIRMFRGEEESSDPRDSRVLRVMRKVIPMSEDYDGDHFLTHVDGRLVATPLLGIVGIVESSDILFAIDSIPAVLSVSQDLVIVYASNILAILCLRQLFFVIEHMQERFAYVRYGVACILVFTGFKMVSGLVGIHVSTPVSIGFILTTLALSILLSSLLSKRQHPVHKAS